jgi:hypothetical protein
MRATLYGRYYDRARIGKIIGFIATHQEDPNHPIQTDQDWIPSIQKR